MSVYSKIQEFIQELPSSLQTEAINLIEGLLSKTEQCESKDWSSLSLASVMRGIKGEDEPIYTPSDLKVTF